MRIKKCLWELLLDYLMDHAGEVQHGAHMGKVGQSYGYEAETAKRRLREITNPKHKNFNARVWKDYEDGCVVYWYPKRRTNLLKTHKIIKNRNKSQTTMPFKAPQKPRRRVFRPVGY